MSDFPTRILHADDDPDICDIIHATFDDYKSLQLKSCHDGAGLISLTESFKPELILLDLHMPGFSGVDALQKMQNVAAFQNLPIIIITGYQDIKMQDDYKKLNIVGVIHKPFSPGMLPERIRHFWAIHCHGKDKALDGVVSSF